MTKTAAKPRSKLAGVWYISVFFMTAMLLLVIGRLIIFGLFWFMGVDFWILPNLFNEDAGVLDSFIPAYSFEYRADDWKMFAIRVFCFVLLCGGLYQLNQVHSVDDMRNFAETSFIDLLEWGKNKLAAPPQPTRRFPSLDEISTTEHDDAPSSEPTPKPFECLAPCGVEPDEDLLTSCKTLTELEKTSCFRKCTDSEKDKLTEARVLQCVSEQEL
mmetsp:Transcript_10669/g.30816  ORF Transcript_10669/g.30816 Transcript_10669/m.30816 type:complete len:215 (-) Transcript_10669:3298-3942(-)